MARLSEQIIAGLTRPSFSRGMFDIGQSIGRVPQQMRQQRERREEESRQKGVTGGLFGMENLIAEGVDPTEAVGSLVGLGATPEQIAAAQQRGTARRDKAEAERVQQNENLLAQMVTGPDFDFSNPEHENAYYQVAERFDVTQQRAQEIWEGLNPEKEDIDNRFSFADGDTWKDSKGNYYAQGKRRDKVTGKQETTFSPITPGAPNDPIGAVTPVMPGTLETRKERMGRETGTAIETRKGLNFEDIRSEVATQFGPTMENLTKVERLLEILPALEQGGALAEYEAELKELLGVQTVSEGMFKKGVRRLALAAIGALGANPTEPERQFIMSIQPSLRDTQEVNTATLTQIRDELLRAVDRQSYITVATDLEDYTNYVKEQYKETADVEPKSGKKRVNYKDL